jgi:hypothetical protein
MGRIARLVVCALVVCPPPVFAQRFDDVGVRAQGLGGAFVAVADDASATWWNPAGLATALHTVDLTGEVSQGGRGGVALGFPSLGLSYYRLKISKIQPSGSTASVGSSRQDNGAVGSSVPTSDVGANQFGLTVGQSLNRHLVVATTVKLVNAQGDTRPDLDVGAMSAFGVMRLGVTVRNVRSQTFGSGADAIELERRARAGAAVIAPGRGRFAGLAIAVDADLTTAHEGGRDEQEIAGGVETWWFGRRIGVRGGGGTNTAAGGGSFGAFGVTVSPYPRVNVVGAVTRGSDSARDRWSVGVRLAY